MLTKKMAALSMVIGLTALLAGCALQSPIRGKLDQGPEGSPAAAHQDQHPSEPSGPLTTMRRNVIEVSGSESLAEKINAVDKSLGAQAGTIEVLDGGVINQTLHLSPHHSLRFASGEWVFEKSPGIEVSSYSSIVGSGVGETLLRLMPQNGNLVISSDYFDLHGKPDSYILSMGDGSVAQDGKSGKVYGAKLVSISDVTLAGIHKGKISEGNATGIRLYGFWFNISKVSIENFSGDGMLTEYAYSGHTEGNNAAESFISDVKILNNGQSGWVVRGSHDSMVNGLIVAMNGGWGIDVQNRKDYYSGSGLMLSNVHAYGNTLGGVRTQSGANILAFGLESEANFGPGLLLRSNDNVVHGEFYSNRTFGIQIGDASSYSGANYIDAQLHNNKVSQIAFVKSAGYNYIAGVVYASGNQKYFSGSITKDDFVTAAIGGLLGNTVVQHFQGGIEVDTGRNINGVANLMYRQDNGRAPSAILDSDKSSFATLSVVPGTVDECGSKHPGKARVSWHVRRKSIHQVNVMVANPGRESGALFAQGGADGGADTGHWVWPGTRFDLVAADSGNVLATFTVTSKQCVH